MLTIFLPPLCCVFRIACDLVFVRKAAYPEAHTSGLSFRMNRLLNNKLRQHASELRAAAAEGAAPAALQGLKTGPSQCVAVSRRAWSMGARAACGSARKLRGGASGALLTRCV